MIELLTAKELAEWLKVKPSTIRKYVEKGTIPVIRIGITAGRGTMRFSRTQIEKWLEERTEWQKD